MIDRVARQLQRGSTRQELHPDLPMPISWRNERDGSSVCREYWRFLEAHGRGEFVQLDDSRGVFLTPSQLPDAH